MKLGKTPGLDGLTKEFYRTFKDELTPYTEELYKYCLEHGMLPFSWGQVRLVLIPMKQKDLRYLTVYKSISILKADYKILTTVLANRLNKLIGDYIHQNQTRFIRGRFWKDNVKKVLDIAYRAELINTPRALLFLYKEKAFNMIEWQYIHYIIREFGLGVRFQKWLHLLYRDQLAIITYEGQSSSKINLSQGVR